MVTFGDAWALACYHLHQRFAAPFSDAPLSESSSVYDEPVDHENPYTPPLSASVDEPALAREEVDSGEFRPLRTIWIRPRLTVRRIVSVDPRLYVIPLACLAGVGEVLDRASLRSAGDNMPVAGIVATACLLGPLGGLFSLWLSSVLLRFTGAWLGGQASREHLRTAVAWAAVPGVFALPLWIPQLLLFGSDIVVAFIVAGAMQL